MEDQTADQFAGTDQGRTAATQATPTQYGIEQGPWDQLLEKSLEGGGGDRCSLSHPQLTGVLTEKVQVQNAAYKHVAKSYTIVTVSETLTGIGPKHG
jgi:hypothetical protein